MAATITFFADEAGIQNLNGSGLGFFGSSFGQSVEVGAWQDSTYITDGNGVTQGPNVHNIKYVHPASGEVNGNPAWNLLTIPNRYATLNIRFQNDTAVKTQNVKLRIFDRSNINNSASGVTTKVAELIHPDINQAAANGSGDSTWNTPAGSSVIMDLISSPGTSGLRPNGPQTSDTRHDFYCAISSSPDSIGSKNLYGLFVELEFL